MNIRLTKLAETDLLNIKKDVYDASKDEKTVEKILKDIIDSLERLKDFPDSGARYEDDDGKLLYRYVKSGNYYSFYKHIKNNVDIYRILYAKRDYKKILI